MRSARHAPRIAAGLMSLTILATARPNLADPAAPPSAPREDGGEAALFERGLQAFDRGDGLEAARIWEQLFTEGDPEKAWRVLYNLGLAYELAGRRPEAIERFEAFSRKVGEQPGSLPIDYEGRRQDAVERANKLRPALSLLRITPAASGERVMIRVGDREPRSAGFATYLEPGHYTLRMGEGRREISIPLELGAGQMQTLAARQGPPPPSPPPPPYEPPVPIAVLVSGGALSAASVALPIAMWFRADALREDAEALPTFRPDYAGARDDYEAARVQYLATWAVPAALGAATLAMVVADLVDASQARNKRLRATAFLAPGGLLVTGSFE